MFEAEIERGAKVLDKDDPGWALENAKRPIGIKRLNMNSPFTCVLGQHDGDFIPGAKRLGLLDWDTYIAHGFAADDYSDYPQLTAEWRAFIRKRRRDARLALSQTKGSKKP